MTNATTEIELDARLIDSIIHKVIEKKSDNYDNKKKKTNLTSVPLNWMRINRWYKHRLNFNKSKYTNSIKYCQKMYG